MRLQDNVALITGVSKGLGLEIARVYARRGARLVIAARHPEALEQMSRVLAEELAGSGIRVYVVDPGDMNTEMHRHAEPGVDLSRLPGPEVSAPAFARLVEEETAGFGRFKAQEIVAVAETGR